MEIFRVPQRRVPVAVLLDNGQTLEGMFFAPERGAEAAPWRVVDRLNESDEEFVPMACGEDRLLLNKSGIVTVKLSRDEHEVHGLADHAGDEVAVRITLVGGTSLVGRLFVQMPPERHRVLDFLNEAPRFIPVLGEEQVTLVHRSYMLFVRTLQSGS